MNLHQLRCFVLAADELHFGRAAQKLNILPSALGRFIRLLEEDLGTQLFARTTRNVVLTEEGRQLLGDARKLLAQADAMRARFRETVRIKATKLRIGAIDSAAVGLMPMLFNDFNSTHPDVELQLLEDKTIRLVPRVLSGRLDIAFIRPPRSHSPSLVYRHLFYETPVVAIPSIHPLAARKKLSIDDIANEPLITPDRRSRPHSHDLTMKLFEESGYTAKISHVADEKQTIVHLVSAGLGLAVVPRWTSRIAVDGVTYLPLVLGKRMTAGRLPLAAIWIRDSRDELRDSLLQTLMDNIDRYVAKA
ncbi:LysR family transcriptional regulator [Enterovirga sp.]|uniref:LysR family transcriptional regulator n=1 Tax=Enterovirga sp. TaxID=2026350 RepID=UPI002CD78CE1|nr:LysR family transcriptional regulator [Enterovirga sp.]HMO31181.1 LysR family transcriptional regulator [Enterovirga sp.]